jgi:hypothetical protein
VAALQSKRNFAALSQFLQRYHLGRAIRKRANGSWLCQCPSGDAVRVKTHSKHVSWDLLCLFFSLDVGVAVLSDLLLCLCRWWPWRSVVYLNSKEHFDPQTNLVVWGSAHMAHVCRSSCSLWLSVCHWGQNGVSCLNHVERYDPKENKWSKVASMNTRRLVVAVAVLGGYVWVGQMARFLLKLVINLFSWFSCRQCYY